MSQSKRFSELKRRVKTLRKHFLPKTFSPTGNYDKKCLDHARGFILLVHAEIESYFEDRAREKIQQADRMWKEKHVCTDLLCRVLIYHSTKSGKIDGLQLASEELVKKAVNFYLSELEQNNGIKEKNLLTIFLPLGMNHDRIDATFLATLDSFGGVRGRLAHLSIKATQSLDPQSIWQDSWANIEHDLQLLDRNISRLK